MKLSIIIIFVLIAQVAAAPAIQILPFLAIFGLPDIFSPRQEPTPEFGPHDVNITDLLDQPSRAFAFTIERLNANIDKEDSPIETDVFDELHEEAKLIERMINDTIELSHSNITIDIKNETVPTLATN